jgi:hypothetical protein
VQAGVERVQHDVGMGRVGRAHEHRVQPAGVQRRSVVGEAPGDAVARAERLAHARVRLRERGHLEPLGKLREMRQVHGLRHESAADHGDAQPLGHAITPRRLVTAEIRSPDRRAEQRRTRPSAAAGRSRAREGQKVHFRSEYTCKSTRCGLDASP